MRMRTTIGALFVAAVIASAGALAEEKLGIAIYPGAKPDTATADALKKMMSASDAGCYRTGDSVDKVLAFYKKQANLTVMGTTAEGGMFQKKGDDKVSLTVQNPWMDMATGKMMKDTLISIVKQ